MRGMGAFYLDAQQRCLGELVLEMILARHVTASSAVRLGRPK
jgi:hypothetical protein